MVLTENIKGKMVVVINEKRYKLESQLKGRRFELYNLFFSGEFIDCILCWRNDSTNQIETCEYVGNYDPEPIVLSELTKIIKGNAELRAAKLA